MLLFGVCFILYFLKLSNISGFWGNLRRTDKRHIIAKSYQKILRKWMKAKHDVHFLHECRSHNVYPKFVRWRNIKNKTPKERNNYCNKNLNSAIKRRRELKTLTEEHGSILKKIERFYHLDEGNFRYLFDQTVTKKIMQENERNASKET